MVHEDISQILTRGLGGPGGPDGRRPLPWGGLSWSRRVGISIANEIFSVLASE